MTSSGETISGTGKSTEIKEQYKRFIGRKILFILFSIILIFIIAGIAATLGSYPITVTEVYSTIFHGLFQNPETPTPKEIVVWNLRLPRILLAILAGIGLAIAGTMMQGILKNPLASPFTLGIASGAGFGAAVGITLGAGFAAGNYRIIEYFLIVNAFIFALIPTFIIIGLARYKRATPETMILAGIAMLYIFAAATSLMKYFGGRGGASEILGSLGRASWGDITTISIVLAACIPVLMWKSWDINVMGAGDETAKSLGVNVERTRISVLMIASLLTAGIICFTGVIGFIGLIAPHICRMVIGGDNRFLIPASGLFGAAFLLGADTVARTIISPIILPVGILTALMGGPLFFYLILRRKKEYW